MTAAGDQARADFFSDMASAVRAGPTVFAAGIFGILILLFLPVPKFLMDLLLVISMSVSVLILMVAIFIQRPLDFTSFPTVLLVVTMLRLALNVAATRLILAHGHEGPEAAGQMIHAFSQLVMSGSFIIGVILFAILIIVNFVVITKGSGRIAEVAARFTLDAMPGKQMAIDADLSSGLITEPEARARRKELEEESGFFGAMDGAAKFVRGDAVAALIITFINIIGGLIIGVVEHNLPLGVAAKNYTLLTVGEGLVSQIPGLTVSFAAGILVTKAGISGATEKVVYGQLSAFPPALGILSAILFLVALLPDMPKLAFFTFSGLCGYSAYLLAQKSKKTKEIMAMQQAVASTGPTQLPEEPISQTLQIDSIRLELGYGLLTLVNSEDGNRLTQQIKGLRKQMAQEMGFILPSVRIQDNLTLGSYAYIIKIKEIAAGSGELRPHKLLCMDPRGNNISMDGEITTEPTFGLPAMWIEESMREEAMFKGYTVVDAPTVVTTHLTEAVRENIAELLSYAETQKLMDELPGPHQKLIADMVPSQISIGSIQRILQNLLTERVSIRDLSTILEGISEATSYTRSPTTLTEHVRSRLARQLCDVNAAASGYVQLLTLSPEWEQAFAESLVGDGEDKQLSMAPRKLQEFITKVRQAYDKAMESGDSPVMLCSPGIRPYVRSIIERFRPQTTVMSQNEIYPKARIRTIGQI